MQSLHYDNVKSFIRDGPVRFLEETYEDAVGIFDWGTNNSEGKTELDVPSFERHVDDIKNSLRKRFEKIPKAVDYNSGQFAHNVIFVAAVADVFGAATFDDFKSAFTSIQVSLSDTSIRRMLFVALTANWLKLEQRGHQKFYLPNFEGEPCEFGYRASATQREIVRWKRDIRAYWKQNDRQRSFLITDHPRSEVK